MKEIFILAIVFLVAAVIFWLLMEIRSLQIENSLLRQEIVSDFERRAK